MRKLGPGVSEIALVLSFTFNLRPIAEQARASASFRCHDLASLCLILPRPTPLTNEELLGSAGAHSREVGSPPNSALKLILDGPNAAGSTASRRTSSAQRTRCCDAFARTTSTFSTNPHALIRRPIEDVAGRVRT